MTFTTQTIPPRSQVGYLDPEIAGEGQKVIHSDGEVVDWQPPPVKPVIPDLSSVKSLQRYFNRLKHPIFPAWLYHPTFEPRIVRNAEEAEKLGISYRKATDEERMRYGKEHLWDYWSADSEWRHQPINSYKFNTAHPEPGKTFVASPPNPSIAQNAMIADIVPAVAAAVAQSLKMAGSTAPDSVNPADWEEFLKFKAWKKTTEVVTALADDSAGEAGEAYDPLISALSVDVSFSERELWEKEAHIKGVKVDGRWSLERLKAEVERAE